MLTVQKWGNSLGVRIPKAIATQIGLEEGSAIDLDVDNGRIIIQRRRHKLEQLLSQITPKQMHKEVSTGETDGREVW